MNAQRLIAGVKEDFYDLVHSLNSWRFWRTVAVTAVGLVILSIGVNGILVPNTFFVSGFTGLSLLVYYVLGGPSVGVIYWLLNIPVLIIGWRTMSLRFVVLAIIGVFLSGAAMTLTHEVRIPTSDPLMAAVLGGVVTGFGVGLYLRFGGSAGGLDILAAVLRRSFGLPMGTTFIAFNSLIFILGGLVNGSINAAFYTAIAMAVHARVIEKMQTGFHPRKAALIVTQKPDEVATQIIRRLNRGVTFLHGHNGISQRATRIVYTVINMVELARLKEIIFHCDPRAFVAISDASEVIGYRFVTWADEGFTDPGLPSLATVAISPDSPMPSRHD